MRSRSALKLVAISVLAASAVGVMAQRYSPQGMRVGIFFPQSGDVQDALGDSWWRVGFSSQTPQRSEDWESSYDVTYLWQSRYGNRATLLPITFGVTKLMSPDSEVSPYVSFRAGPYIGDVRIGGMGIDDTKVGMNSNATLGILVGETFYVEGRYDYFSKFEGADFSGWMITLGFRFTSSRF
jgi:hypothetical protein